LISITFENAINLRMNELTISDAEEIKNNTLNMNVMYTLK
jgi:hypothetical protein